MIILTTSPAEFIRGLDCEYPHKPIRVALYRGGNDHELFNMEGNLYLEDYKDNQPMLREWDDIPNYENDFQYHGEQYNTAEFLEGCHIWGFDPNDHYDNCECVTVYVYRERL